MKTNGPLPSLEILYRDDDFVAIHKPSGLLVHRTALSADGQSCMSLLRDQVGCHVYPVHRLDRATSGVLLFALSSEAAGAASLAFQERTARKTYLAIVRGYLPAAGTIDKPLPPSINYGRRDAQKRAIGEDSEKKPAITSFHRLATAEIEAPVGRYPTARYSLAHVMPETGRLHQIRRHFASLSHPIVGDTVYGDGKHNRFFRERFGIHRLLLCALELRMPHPLTGQELLIRCEPSPEIGEVGKALGWETKS